MCMYVCGEKARGEKETRTACCIFAIFIFDGMKNKLEAESITAVLKNEDQKRKTRLLI